MELFSAPKLDGVTRKQRNSRDPSKTDVIEGYSDVAWVLSQVSPTYFALCKKLVNK